MTYNEFIQDIINTRGQWNLDVKLSGICERHHILPRCCGGLPKKLDWSHCKNVIWLYPNEHFTAHKLLYEELSTENYGIVIAYYRMSRHKKYTANLSIDELKKIKIDYGRVISEINKKKIICLETKQVFNSVREATDYIKNITGKNRYNKIYDALHNGSSWFGLHWDYFDENKYNDWVAYDQFTGDIPIKLYLRQHHTVEAKSKMKKAWQTRKIKYNESDSMARKKAGITNKNRHLESGLSEREIESHKRIAELQKKPVVCVETHQIFNSISDAVDYMFKLNGLKNKGGIYSALNDQTKFWNKLHWMYLDDYRCKTKDELDLIINHKYKGQALKVVCIETNEIFDSVAAALKWCGGKAFYQIDNVCQGKWETFNNYHWKYLKDI